jgi:GNAT superfamily N-acetyltransferase
MTTDKPTVVLVHGFWGGAAHWAKVIVELRRRYRYEDVGCLTTAATLPSHRNRGIQSALISRRAKEAAADGCRRLVAETGKPALAGRTRRSTT